MALSFTRTDYPAGPNPYGAAIGDLNGDGVLDLAVTNYYSSTVSVLLGNGDGTFQTPATYATGGSGVVSVQIGDLNGDGEPDLVATSEGNDTVSVLLGNGDGTFANETSYTTGGLPHGVAIADVDGDGDSDLLVDDFASNTVSVFLGTGDGSFEQPTAYATEANPYAIKVGDLNADSNLDLVVGNMSSNTISVLLGNGDGTFQAQTTYATGVTPWEGALGDLNGDNKLDFAIANVGDTTVSVYLGNGDGSFQPQVTYAAGNGPTAVVIGDLNGDNTPDLAASNSDSEVAVLLGNGDGTFQGAETYSVGGFPSWLVVGDLDGNGKRDLATANWSGDFVSVLLNTTGSNNAPVITSNDGELAVFYPFDEAGGSIAHDQQGLHDGTIIGATHVPGVTGNALQFNGSSDYVSVPDSPEWNLGSEFTIEFWANFNSVPDGSQGDGQGGVPIGQDEGGGSQNKWFFEVFSGGIGFHVNTTPAGEHFFIAAPFEPTPGQWYAFALTKSGSSYQFYVDGQLVGSAEATLAIPDVAAPLMIGRSEEAFYFDGQLDGVAIHHRALSQAEVQQGYENGAAAPDAISATISIAENTTAVTTVVATDPDAGQTLSYSIAGGADAELFTIDTETGALAFVTAPDFEAPADDGTNNVYDVTVEVTDNNGGVDTQAISVTVTDENENENAAPTITSNGGGNTAAVSISENATAVTTVVATDPDVEQTLTYSITGGADATKFTINSETGALAFVTAPDFEAPADVGPNNVYDVTLEVSDDNGGIDTQVISVTVQNVSGVTINGTSKADTRTGSGEEDVINGLGGNDTLNGLAGNDVINGGAGNDTLNGGTGNDAMTGGTGNDVYVVDSLGDTVTEAMGQGTDTIETRLNSFSLASVANLENLTFIGAGDSVGTGNALNNTIRGGNGNDRFVATIGDGNDSYFGGNGVDTIDLSGTTAAATVTGSNATSAQIGSDTLGGIENMIGSQGNDQITGTGAANVIDGGNGNDNINAGGGNDRIIGGAGNDTMDGVGASDTFVFAPGFGNDRIIAFDANPSGGQDFLDISAFGIAPGNFATRVTIADVGADTLVTIDGDPGQTIRLVGIGNAVTVTQADFML
ncbi:VCBS repeat-containing protein [Bradyrhizobium sp. AUGA SZCCT0222]|uniref:FG-GAP-like repeat-containing protein n=1 Tax=Bradyrhizobium sp. AUGA SZCCT0222 TaxID=2807668 RepID=UPI001BA62272|nr:FG-GAP-like repeat-containing protein [Bradyrhizobium sp. AUGA SZCCT0222]MBR1266919.1 VCBS repeat-containing protein [Bradyrhizobium sp. AUGA SZCCT0222]